MNLFGESLVLSTRLVSWVSLSVKDPIPMEKKSGVVYEVPCSYGKV